MSEMGMAMMGTGIARGENRAREAAEAAINSPLLEDIDLKGASGVLVNITAGLDLSLGEFSEVGDLVEDYAHEDATVVVGTVIDPELTDELKVTVVATGLARAQAAESRVVNGSTTASASSRQPVSTTDFSQLELPTVLRNRQQEDKARPVAVEKSEPAADVAAVKKTGTDDMDFLDIPAFLRRQAD
jgi:cell division protein FtsZ